jgi:PAS domain-containing protein
VCLIFSHAGSECSDFTRIFAGVLCDLAYKTSFGKIAGPFGRNTAMGNNTFRESDLMAILEGVNDGVIKLDRDANYLALNRAAAEVFKQWAAILKR